MQPTLETNPFGVTDFGSAGPITEAGVNFAPILHRWEKYRLWYNSILILHTLSWTTFVSPSLLLDALFWFQIVFLGGICNLCFFTGPAIEAYGRYFGLWSNLLSLMLFLVGLMFTGLLDTAFLVVRAQ